MKKKPITVETDTGTITVPVLSPLEAVVRLGGFEDEDLIEDLKELIDETKLEKVLEEGKGRYKSQLLKIFEKDDRELLAARKAIRTVQRSRYFSPEIKQRLQEELTQYPLYKVPSTENYKKVCGRMIDRLYDLLHPNALHHVSMGRIYALIACLLNIYYRTESYRWTPARVKKALEYQTGRKTSRT